MVVKTRVKRLKLVTREHIVKVGYIVKLVIQRLRRLKYILVTGREYKLVALGLKNRNFVLDTFEVRR